MAVLILGLVQALPLASGLAPFVRSGYPVVGLACWIAMLSVLIAHALEWRTGKPLQGTARFALMFTAAALYLKLLALLHPSKLPVDVIFQAHRLEWVMSGRYFVHPTAGQRRSVSVRDRALRVCRALVAADQRPRHAAADCRLRL